ncbi:MAG: hypothetical protein IKS65_04100 [Bacteroidales bacterium]|nr:hypothetical protein [Bacteroidales bacterium]
MRKKISGYFLFFSIIIVFVSSVAFLIAKNNYLWTWLALLLSIVSFVVFAVKAYNSLNNDSIENIIPPAMFWQVFFNKIPARILNANSQRIRFAVVEMDDCDEVKQSSEIIRESYSRSNKIVVEVVSGYRRKKDGKLSFDLKKLLNIHELSGVIFIIGTVADNDAQLKELRTVIDEFSNVKREVPIGYVKAGNNLQFKLHFEEIGQDQLGNCAHHLIVRGYSRSRMQFDLGNAFHRTCGVLLLLLLAALVGIGIFLLSSQRGDDYNKWTKELQYDVYKYENERGDYIWDNINLDSVRTDVELYQLLDEISDYYFGDLYSYKGVKIWLRGANSNDSLYRVFYNIDDYVFSDVIPSTYCVGHVAKHRLFFLWPGVNNENNSLFLDNPKVAWLYNENNDNKIRDGRLDMEKKQWSGRIYENGVWSEDTIRWMVSKRASDDNLAMYCFSYDGIMVVEIDCLSGEIENDYNYMSSLMFRNTFRKYVKLVYCLLQQYKY